MIESTPNTNREKLAGVVHDSWSHWMQHVFKNAVVNPDGSVTIPATLVARWKRQMKTQYQLLSEKEKDSDREQADKFLAVLKNQGKENQDNE